MHFARLGCTILLTSLATCAFGQAAPHASVSTQAAAALVPIALTWVSGSGSDGNPCTRSLPCATFAAALSLTLPGGEVAVLDAGDFGPLNITQAVTISGAGGMVSAASSSSSSAAISVAAGAGDAVTLRNLELNGAGASGSGIQISSAKAVHLENLRVINFPQFGVIVSNKNSVVVTMHDSTISNNGYGLGAQAVSGIASILIAHCHFAQTKYGVLALDGTHVTVTDSDATRGDIAYVSSQAGSFINLIRSKAAYELVAGVEADVNGVVSMSDLTLANNKVAGSASQGGQLVSFGNNAFTNAITVNTTVPLQ